VLDRHCLSVDLVQVRLNTLAGTEGGFNSRCRITIKLLPGGSVRAEASDREAVLALYRAADKAVFLLWQCLKSANCGQVAERGDALYSTVMMPPGIPVATVAVDGAKNAAYLACSILSIKHSELAEKLEEFRGKTRQSLPEKPRELKARTA